MPPLMRVERAFPLHWPLSQEHGFGSLLARRLVVDVDWALVQLCGVTGGAFQLVEVLVLLSITDAAKIYKELLCKGRRAEK